MKLKIRSLLIVLMVIFSLSGCNFRQDNISTTNVLKKEDKVCEKFWSLKICKEWKQKKIYSGSQIIFIADDSYKYFEKRWDKLFYFNSGWKLTVIDWILWKKQTFDNCVLWGKRFVCYVSWNVKIFDKNLKDVKGIKDILSKLVKWIWWQKVKKEVLNFNLSGQDLEWFFKKKWRVIKYIIFESWWNYYKMWIDGNVTGVKLNFKLDKILFIESVYSPEISRLYKGDFYNPSYCDITFDDWPCEMKVFVDYFNPDDRYLLYKDVFSKDIKVVLNGKTYWLLWDFLVNLYTFEDSNHYESGCYLLIDSEYKDGYWVYTVYRNRWSLVDTGDNCRLEDVTKIWVFWQHNGKRDKEYILKSYNPKKGTFKYKISEKFWNYTANWDKYIFRFYLSGWGYTEYVIDFDYLVRYKNFCLRPTKEMLDNLHFLNPSIVAKLLQKKHPKYIIFPKRDDFFCINGWKVLVNWKFYPIEWKYDKKWNVIGMDYFYDTPDIFYQISVSIKRNYIKFELGDFPPYVCKVSWDNVNCWYEVCWELFSNWRDFYDLTWKLAVWNLRDNDCKFIDISSWFKYSGYYRRWKFLKDIWCGCYSFYITEEFNEEYRCVGGSGKYYIFENEVDNKRNKIKVIRKNYSSWFLFYTEDWKLLKIQHYSQCDADWTDIYKTFLNWKEVK